MSVVRSAALNQSSSTSIARTFSTQASPAAAPATGHLLISCLVTTVLQSSVTPPAGWTVIQSMPLSSTYLYASWAYKFCDGTDDTVTWSWGSASTATLVIVEFDDAVTALDSSAEDETDINTPATTFDTGSATATVSTGLALAFFGIDSGRNVDAGRAYSASFSELIASFAAAADRGGVFLASKAVSGAGSYACQYTCSDTGDRGYGSIAVFGTPSGGSTTSVSTSDGATAAAVFVGAAAAAGALSGTATASSSIAAVAAAGGVLSAGATASNAASAAATALASLLTASIAGQSWAAAAATAATFGASAGASATFNGSLLIESALSSSASAAASFVSSAQALAAMTSTTSAADIAAAVASAAAVITAQGLATASFTAVSEVVVSASSLIARFRVYPALEGGFTVRPVFEAEFDLFPALDAPFNIH